MKNDKLQKKTTRIKDQRLQILHQLALQLLDVKENREIYRIISDAINQVLPGVIFVAIKLQTDDMNYRIIESSGFDKYFKAIKELIGKDPFLLDFPIKDLSDDKLTTLESRKIYKFSRGIYDLLNGSLSRTVCSKIEEMLDISDVYAIGFSVEKKFQGGISLFIPNSIVKAGYFDEEAILLIETISYLASNVIQRLAESKAAKEKEAEFQNSQTRFINLLIN